MRILVVDDDPAVTALLVRGLKYEGYAVDVAASGEEGLRLAERHRPDLVVLDVMCPAPTALRSANGSGPPTADSPS